MRCLSLICITVFLAATTAFAKPITKSSSHALSEAADAPTAELTVTVDRDTLTVADSLQMTITVRQPPGTKAQLPSFEELGFATSFTERSQRFRVTNISDPQETLDTTGTLTLQQTYTLEPWLSGNYAILPVMVSFYADTEKEPKAAHEDAQSVSIPLFSLMADGIRLPVTALSRERNQLSDLLGQANVTSNDLLERERRAEDKSDEELKREEEEKKAAAMALQERPFPWWILWSLCALGSISALVWFVGRHKVATLFSKKSTPPHMKAFAALDALLKDDLVNQGRIKEYYYKLSFILREYIGGRFHIFADKQTTEEFFQALLVTNPFDSVTEQIIRDFLESADTVKYSLSRPDTASAQKSYDIARSFVEHTKPTEEDKS